MSFAWKISSVKVIKQLSKNRDLAMDCGAADKRIKARAFLWLGVRMSMSAHDGKTVLFMQLHIHFMSSTQTR